MPVTLLNVSLKGMIVLSNHFSSLLSELYLKITLPSLPLSTTFFSQTARASMYVCSINISISLGMSVTFCGMLKSR
ncbi:MAG: hypothetical protein ACD_79C00827G0001 [uncultured bacterium]|nr:MAG: hypothetical protein ACD_79C00827G0001 [uncultured bacterium]